MTTLIGKTIFYALLVLASGLACATIYMMVIDLMIWVNSVQPVVTA